ncbi:MAG: hypothetical protein Q8Q01_03100 [archaeon]|nr:hypothetical protein [archaeon]
MSLIERCRKGQMEAMGLVVIVILITLGMLFLAQFALKEAGEKKIFTRKGLAYSSMSAILKTTVETDCRANTIPYLGRDVLEDCAINLADSPEGYSKYKCSGLHSCVFAEQKITTLLLNTLGEWNKRYEFQSRLINNEGAMPIFTITNKGGCTGRERDTSGLFPIQAENAGLIENILFICD